MEPPVEIRHVILYADLRPGGLMLAECADGSLRILRDENPVHGCCWEHDQIEAAAAEFRRLSAEWEGKAK